MEGGINGSDKREGWMYAAVKMRKIKIKFCELWGKCESYNFLMQ